MTINFPNLIKFNTKSQSRKLVNSQLTSQSDTHKPKNLEYPAPNFMPHQNFTRTVQTKTHNFHQKHLQLNFKFHTHSVYMQKNQQSCTTKSNANFKLIKCPRDEIFCHQFMWTRKKFSYVRHKNSHKQFPLHVK